MQKIQKLIKSIHSSEYFENQGLHIDFKIKDSVDLIQSIKKIDGSATFDDIILRYLKEKHGVEKQKIVSDQTCSSGRYGYTTHIFYFN